MDAAGIIEGVVSALISLIPVGIFLSGALASALCWLFGRKLLRKLWRWVTRTYTLYVVGNIAGTLGASLRANNIRTRSFHVITSDGAKPALIKVCVKLNSMRRAKAALDWIKQGIRSTPGVLDVYAE